MCRHEGVKKSEKKIDVLAVAAYDNNGTTLENKHKHLCKWPFCKEPFSPCTLTDCAQFTKCSFSNSISRQSQVRFLD